MAEKPTIESKDGPTCPQCGIIKKYIEHIDWSFTYVSCERCGRNFEARLKTTSMHNKLVTESGHIIYEVKDNSPRQLYSIRQRSLSQLRM